MSIAKWYGIDMAEVCLHRATSSNDVPMLRIAGLSIAMGNAPAGGGGRGQMEHTAFERRATGWAAMRWIASSCRARPRHRRSLPMARPAP